MSSIYRKYKSKATDADPDNPERHDPWITAWDKAAETHGPYLMCDFPKEIVDINLDGSYELPPAQAQSWETVRHGSLDPGPHNAKPKSHPPAPGKVGAE